MYRPLLRATIPKNSNLLIFLGIFVFLLYEDKCE